MQRQQTTRPRSRAQQRRPSSPCSAQREVRCCCSRCTCVGARLRRRTASVATRSTAPSLGIARSDGRTRPGTASPAGFSIAEWNGLDRVDIAPDSFATIGDVKFIEYGDCKLHWGGVLALAPGNRRERLQPRARSLVATTATGRTRARWPFTRSATRSDLRTLGPEVQPLLEGSIGTSAHAAPERPPTALTTSVTTQGCGGMRNRNHFNDVEPYDVRSTPAPHRRVWDGGPLCREGTTSFARGGRRGYQRTEVSYTFDPRNKRALGSPSDNVFVGRVVGRRGVLCSVTSDESVTIAGRSSRSRCGAT
jgi:hypothetical protein